MNQGRVLVLAECQLGGLNPALRSVLSAAQALGSVIEVLLVGHSCAPVAQALATLAGVSKVLLIDDPRLAHPSAEQLADLILEQQQQQPYHAILAAASTFGKNVLPRVAALLGVAQISEVIKILDANTFVRPIYAGHALVTLRSEDPVQVMTIRAPNFPAVAKQETAAPIQQFTPSALSEPRSRWISSQESKTDRPELSTAERVVSGGRGLQSRENFALVEQLADQLGAALGASRAAVDAGFVSNDHQVGQTGKIVAPKLYIAVGISGAIQHIAGMKDSQVIVAINKDPDAPIFQYANYGLVGDLFEILPALLKALSLESTT